jgi:hypothetical protein
MAGKRKAFVLMPFRQPFDSYYLAIFRPVLEASGFSVQRADDIYTPRPVMLDIQESILAADLILCEMTGRSPNVFYELGLAHAAGKPTILVSTSEEDIPFDLRHVRVINYETQMAGWEDRLRLAIGKSAVAATASGNIWPPPLGSASKSDRDSGMTTSRSTLDKGQRDPRVVDRPINLGFDGAVEGGYPHGWFNSLGHVSNVSPNYAVRVVDRDDSLPGKCLMVFKSTAEHGEFGSVMQRFPADFLANRVVRLEGAIRASEVRGWAGLWLRADGEKTPNVFFDNMKGHKVEGTTGWTRHTVEASLPRSSAWLNLGIVFSGSGTVWADNLRLLYWSDQATWVDV